MGEFFRGWRPKLGVATLVVTCLLAAGWATSYLFDGEILLVNGSLSSNSGTIIFVYSLPPTGYVEHLLYWEIDYWSIVLPLTLLSSYLLLSKSRTKQFGTMPRHEIDAQDRSLAEDL